MNLDRRHFLKKIGVGSTMALVSPPAANGNYPPERVYQHDKILLSQNNAIVETTTGKIRGYTQRGIYTFKGIPYAATTADQFRFMPPRKVEPWTGVKNCIVYGSACPQKPNQGWSAEEYAFLFQWVDGHQDEDCLKLNVWTPSTDSVKKRPVMFWIHGGAFFSGSSYEHPSNDGRNLSELGDVVVVSINHRLNVFGFLNLAQYGSQYELSANVGMLDIVAALQWVKENISAFGGDPENVTLFGQSGGAAKVTTLMAMPGAKGLFHKAIAQSSSTMKVATVDYSAQICEYVLSELQITKDNLRQIHEIPFQRLIAAGMAAEKKLNGYFPKDVGRAGWQPVVDGNVLPTHPFDPKVPEFSAHIPMLIGSNRNEWSASIGDINIESLDEAGLKLKLQEKYGNKSEPFYKIIRQVYPDIKPVEVLSYLNPYNNMAYYQAERKSAQPAPVYHYMFSWNTRMLDGRPRACHCSEMPFVFYNTERCETMTGATEEARSLSEKMALAWTNFAKQENPNHAGLPTWPPFSKANGAIMIFDNQCEIKNDPDKLFREAMAVL